MSSQEPGSASFAQIFSGLISLGILGYFAYMFFGGGIEKEADKSMDAIFQQVADDAVSQYRITKASGSAIDQCVQAGMVAAAYLQAQNQTSYSVWKQTEAADCARAGVPR